jgi:hypothetical protein
VFGLLGWNWWCFFEFPTSHPRVACLHVYGSCWWVVVLILTRNMHVIGHRTCTRDWTRNMHMIGHETCTRLDTEHARDWTRNMHMIGHETCTWLDTKMHMIGYETCTWLDTKYARDWTRNKHVIGHETCTWLDTIWIGFPWDSNGCLGLFKTHFFYEFAIYWGIKQ